MEKEQADIIRQQLQQKPTPYELVEINNTSSNQPSVIAIPPTISKMKMLTIWNLTAVQDKRDNRKLSKYMTS